MKVRVDHIALVKCPNLGADKTVDLNDNATVTDLLNALGMVEEHQKAVVPFINRERAKRNHSLKEGDDVFLSLAIGGGGSRETTRPGH